MHTPRQIVTAYFHQLVFGCDSLACTTANCRSCSLFHHELSDPDAAAFLSLRLARDHWFHPTLCDGLSPVVFEPGLRDQADEFTSVVRQLHANAGVGLSKSEAMAAISTALHDVDVFAYIMLGAGQQSSLRTLALDADQIIILCSVTSLHTDLFAPSAPQFKRLVGQICATQKFTFRLLRALLLTFCFTEFMIGNGVSHEFAQIMNFVNSLPSDIQELVLIEFPRIPALFTQALYIAQTNLTVWSLNCLIETRHSRSMWANRVHSLDVQMMAVFINNLRFVASDENMTSEFFVNEVFTNLLSPEKELISFLNGDENHSIFSWPSVLTLRFKNAVLQLFSRIRHESIIHVVIHRRGNAVTERDVRLFLEVKRDDIVNTTLQALENVDAETLTKKLIVVFKGEQAHDGGGVAREFFYLFCKAAFLEDYGLFKRVTGGKYWFQTNPQQSVVYFSLLGTIMALALDNSVLLPIRFPRLLYKKLCRRKLLLKDLADIDEELMGSFEMLRAIRARGEEVGDCELTFSVSTDSFDPHGSVYPLKAGGEAIVVTNENLDEYIDLYSHYLMVTAVERQFNHFQKGFHKIGANHIFGIFLYDEIDILVSGTDVSNWNELKERARYIDGYTVDSLTVNWFWEVFDDLTDDQKRLLLRFTTGSDRTPVSGLSDVRLTLQRMGDPEKLPVAHTCFNILSLPDYPSKSVLKRNLVIAIENAEGFGLI
jgi:ubiquitin-protein ligase E3 A